MPHSAAQRLLQRLFPQVYPLQMLRRKINAFKLDRLEQERNRPAPPRLRRCVWRERCCVQIYTLGERLLARNSWDEALEVHEARVRVAVE